MTDIFYSIATWLVPLTIAIVFHEVAHGFVARVFGDQTAARLGRLTLNPVKHVDPIGTVALPMMLAVAGAPIFGWAKPVPVNPNRLRNPRWHMVLVALAGPGINIVMAVLAIVVMALLAAPYPAGSGPIAAFVWTNLTNFVLINVMLAVFNMLPLPPFDGSHVVEGVLPRPLSRQYARLRPFGMAAMLILFVAVPVLFPESQLLQTVIGPPINWVLVQMQTLFGAII
jgi:Zn-dependent protease